MTIVTTRQSVDLKTDASFFALLTESYARLVGTPLVPPGKDATWLYREAPFVVLAHGPDPDPHFIYANKAAQDCFGYSWEEFLALPSRLSAETQDQAERQRLARSGPPRRLHVRLSRRSHCQVGPALYHRRTASSGS